MTIYLKLDGEAVAYPYSVDQLRADNPDTSFSAVMPDERLADWGIFPVAPAAAPSTELDEIAEEAAPALVDGVWTQQWTVRARTAGELTAAKAAKWAAAKALRDAAIDGGCTVAGIGRFDTDLISRSNINGAVTGAMIAQAASQTFAVTWKLADNSIIGLDAADMITAGLAVLTHVSACHAVAQTIGLAIEAAQDFAALEAIDIESGWPA